MNMKAYGTEMLKKQLGYAKAKGNKEYVSELESEISKRESARIAKAAAKVDVVKEPVGLAGTQIPAMNIPEIKNTEIEPISEATEL